MPALQMRKWTPDSVVARTLAYGRLAGIAVEAGGREWTSVPSAGCSGSGFIFHCAWGEAGCDVFVGPDWDAVVAAFLGISVPDVAALPDPLVQAAFECFADHALSDLEKISGLTCSVAGFDRSEHRVDDGGAVAVEWVRDDGMRFRTGLRMRPPYEPWIEMLKRLPQHPVRDGSFPDSDVAFTGEVCLGGWRLPVGQTNGLAEGDVVLLPGRAAPFLRVGKKLRFACTREKTRLLAEGSTMTTTEELPERNEPDTVSIDEAELDLVARVGTISVSLSRLRQLGEGQVVEFDTGVDSPVTLLAGGRPIARGELVDVGGRIGVCIVEMKRGS